MSDKWNRIINKNFNLEKRICGPDERMHHIDHGHNITTEYTWCPITNHPKGNLHIIQILIHLRLTYKGDRTKGLIHTFMTF